MNRFFDFDGCAVSLCEMLGRHDASISDSEWTKFLGRTNMFLDECKEIYHGEVIAYARSLSQLLTSSRGNTPSSEQWREIADATRSLLAELDENSLFDENIICGWRDVFAGY